MTEQNTGATCSARPRACGRIETVILRGDKNDQFQRHRSTILRRLKNQPGYNLCWWDHTEPDGLDTGTGSGSTSNRIDAVSRGCRSGRCCRHVEKPWIKRAGITIGMAPIKSHHRPWRRDHDAEVDVMPELIAQYRPTRR